MNHNFSDSLRKSHEASNLPIWEEFYRKVFLDFQQRIYHGKNGHHQHAGIDVSVILNNSKQVLIDEKSRWEEYGDILIEFVSSDKGKTPGWAEKELLCDYICYVVHPSRRCHLLPAIQLQLAWKKNKEDWIKKYGTIPVRNDGYRTINCPVPTDVLFDQMVKVLTVEELPLPKLSDSETKELFYVSR